MESAEALSPGYTYRAILILSNFHVHMANATNTGNWFNFAGVTKTKKQQPHKTPEIGLTHCKAPFMTRTSTRQRRVKELEEDIRWLNEEQEFKLLCDDDPLDDLYLILEDDIKNRYKHLCSQRFLDRRRTYRRGNAWRIYAKKRNEEASMTLLSVFWIQNTLD